MKTATAAAAAPAPESNIQTPENYIILLVIVYYYQCSTTAASAAIWGALCPLLPLCRCKSLDLGDFPPGQALALVQLVLYAGREMPQ